MGKLTYQIEVLTPVHVGNGRQILPPEYVLDSEARKIVRVDLDSLFREKGFPIVRYINAVRQPGFYLGSEFRTASVRHPLYQFKSGGNIHELSRYLRRSAGAFLEHIKDGGKPYLPGSSIKGAIRSLILKYLLSSDRSDYEEELNRSIRLRKEGKKEERQLKTFSTEAENLVLGRTNRSLLRALQVSDSSTIEPSQLELGCVKILSLTQEGYAWKDLANRRNLKDFEDATPIFFESLPAGTILSGSFKTDDDLLTGYCADQLSYRSEGVQAIKRLFSVCKQGSMELLQKEAAFFEAIRLKPCLDAAINLMSVVQSCQENQMVFPLAWGTGYNAKANGWIIDSDLMDMVRREFNLGREGFEFPKSRKILFFQGEPANLVGWVRLSIV
jgi:CRISPR-associated protein Csm5